MAPIYQKLKGHFGHKWNINMRVNCFLFFFCFKLLQFKAPVIEFYVFIDRKLKRKTREKGRWWKTPRKFQDNMIFLSPFGWFYNYKMFQKGFSSTSIRKVSLFDKTTTFINCWFLSLEHIYTSTKLTLGAKHFRIRLRRWKTSWPRGRKRKTCMKIL